MSGFISTMFVSSSCDVPVAFPAKPKPLLPIFTFAQSQSCLNLRMDLEVVEFHEQNLSGNTDRPRSGLDLTRPKETYQSPLQRIGQALRIQQAVSESLTYAPAPTPSIDPPSRPEPNKLTPEYSEYSYKPISSAIGPARYVANIGDGLLSAHDLGGSIHTGSIIGPAARAEQLIPRNKGYFAGTRLLSSFYSNPRTRAPFKPQKSSRGTSSWQLKQYAEATLGSGSLRKAVKLPEGEDKDEWLAVNGELPCEDNGGSADT
jgi:MOB kinase activator 1